MMKQGSVFTNKSERGIALLAVLFTLVLLSVIGLGMMYSTNMESSINSNFRDKQISYYASLAGLQEARERIRYPFNITPPTALPDPSFPNIIYIVADPGTVQPWNPDNPYFDTELCQERVLDLTGTPGVPCTEAPAGDDWYQVIDNSDVSSAPWNLAYPTDWKWTRIQLKGNNNTPVPVNGDADNAEQACWNGTSQMSTPTGYTVGCKPVGPVSAIAVTTGGINYTSPPTVTLTGGGGSGATATAVLGAGMTGYVASITVDAGGAGYASPPTVTIPGTATATAVLGTTGSTVNTGTVNSVTLTSGGGGFLTPPTVSFVGGGGSGATATTTLTTTGTPTTVSYVNEINVTSGGSGYTTAPAVDLPGGGGSGATATANLASSGSVKTVSLVDQGTQCYSSPTDAVVTFTGGGGGTGAAASAVMEGSKSCIFAVTPTNVPHCSAQLSTANGYSPEDQKSGVTFAVAGQNESFSGTLFVSTANHKGPLSMSVQNPGHDASGYSANTFTSQLKLAAGAWADCGNITVTATTGYRIASLNLTSGGSGYSSAPTVMITGGVGTTSNPTANATLGFPIGSVSVTAGGTGYTSAPAVSFTGGSGTGAAANATIITTSTTTYEVQSISLGSGGAGYTSAPTVVLSGGGGTGAGATATVATMDITTYPVASITVNSGGTGYSVASPPMVTLSGGGGSGAAATAVVNLTPTGSLMVDHIDVTAPGFGYTSNPTVSFSGGGGTGAEAIAQIASGPKYGKVYLLTSLAQTATGARTMVQWEVAGPVLGYARGGALTLDGPNPAIGAFPDSNNFWIRGNDANSCGETEEPDVPAIAGYDDPNADPPTESVETIVDALPDGRTDQYVGAGETPSVQNGYYGLGETMGTPAGLESVIGAIYNAPGSVHYNPSNVNSFNPSATVNGSITYVEGDLTLAGASTGRGILVVTGTLVMSGNFSWYGIVFVVGDGIIQMAGAGTGQIVGSLWVAKIWDNYTDKNLLESLGAPTFDFVGGGNNGIQYDHCYVTNLMEAINMDDLNSTKPLKILSTRVLPY